MTFNPPAMKEHPRPEADGNRALLVLVNSKGSYADTSIVDRTVLCALHHLGMPFRIHDLASAPLTPQHLSNCAAIILAQERLGSSISKECASLIVSAITESGLGFVSLDNDLASYPPPLLALLGIRVAPIPLVSDLLRLEGGVHYITQTLPAGRMVKLHRPVPMAQIDQIGRGVSELGQAVMGKEQLVNARHHAPGTAYLPGQSPALLAAACGRGRAVQFAWSPRLWLPEFLGHAMGLDALFWRSIVWAARKPFAAQLMPPLVTLRIDDASGRHDMHYAKVVAGHGFRPLISCFLDNISGEHTPLMRILYESHQVDWDAHAFDYYHLIPYNFGVGEYSESELADNFNRIDEWYAARGLKPPRTPYFHWGEVGVRALPYLKARGRTYLYSPYHLGQLKVERLFPNFWPYGLNSYFYDYVPEDPEMYNIGASLPRHLMPHDILTGCTTWTGENPVNDVEKAAARSAEAVRLALDSGFFAEITTHEQKIGVLSLEEIDRWMARTVREISIYEPRLVGHEEAADTTKARDESWVAASACPDGVNLQITLDGRAAVPTELAVFNDDKEGISQQWVGIPPFDRPLQLDL